MRNLEAEMKRYGVTIADIQSLLGCTEKTVRNKLNEDSPFTFRETSKIRDAYFRGLRLEYLFSEDRPDDRRDSA